jgi:RNA polymerase sigma factor (sigma-70 family)
MGQQRLRGPNLTLVRAIEARIEAAIPRLHRFAWSLTGDSADADDVTQAALERALINKAKFDRDTHIEAWLIRVARNIWLDQLRRQKVRTAGVDPEVYGRIHAIAGFSGAQERMEVGDAMRVFDELPSGQKEVAALVLIEGFSYQEAAAALEIPVGTVMSRLSRARTMLAERLLGPEGQTAGSVAARP